MKMINNQEMTTVTGGANTAAVVANASTAESVCGKGNVKSVSETGFECK